MSVDRSYGYTLASILPRIERQFGRRQAVSDDGTRMTYSELAERCYRLAGALGQAGALPGDRVAVLMANGHRYLETLLAIPSCGLVVVPLNPRLSTPELGYILDDAEVRILIVDDDHAEAGEALAGSVGAVIRAPFDYESVLLSAPATPPVGTIAVDDLAALFYTGGTTGAARGVMLTHGNLAANALHTLATLAYTQDDVYLHAAPMFHLADGLSTWSVTLVGASHSFVPRFDPDTVLATIETDGVTASLLVPAMLNLLVRSPRLPSTDLGSLRLLLHGGAPIATELLRQCTSIMRCSFTQLYGMTETAPVLTVLPQEERLIGHARLRSAGRAVPGVELEIRDAEGNEVAPGKQGEIVARGPNVMKGYWRRPDETRAVLSDDGWLSTGDLAYADDEGYVFIVDRAKDMIISGGENVYSIEVEDALVAHPAVIEAAVIGVPDDEWGERVHAVLVVEEGRDDLDLEEVRTHCKQLIGGFKAPRSIEIVDALPKSGAGKILKRELRDRHWATAGRRVN